jgi:hypothetical protein
MKAPAPLAAVAVGNGAVPVLVVAWAIEVLVKTVPVRSLGAPEMMVGVPLMVVATGVTVFAWPDSSTVTQRSVGSARGGIAIEAPAGIAEAIPESSKAADRNCSAACIVGYAELIKRKTTKK